MRGNSGLPTSAQAAALTHTTRRGSDRHTSCRTEHAELAAAGVARLEEALACMLLPDVYAMAL